MNDSSVDQLATPGQLGLIAVASVIVIALIMAGTAAGNDDLYRKAGREMRKLADLCWYGVAWIKEGMFWLARTARRHEGTYQARHCSNIRGTMIRYRAQHLVMS